MDAKEIEAKQKTESVATDCENLKREMQRLEKECTNLTIQKDQKTSRLANAFDVKTRHIRYLSSFLFVFTSFRRDCAGLELEVKDLEARVKGRQNNVKQNQEAIATLQTQIGQHEAELNTVKLLILEKVF